MREIKFKFWLEHTKKMTYAHSLMDIPRIFPDLTGDIIPLQFTGLKDKNGKRICEGDIIIFTWFSYVGHEIEETKTGEVDFINDAFVFFNSDGAYPFCDLNFDSESDIEVIGNIYENPELLNQKEEQND